MCLSWYFSLMQLAKGVTLKQGALSKTFDPRSASSSNSGGGDTSASGVAVGAGVDNALAELRGLTRKEYLKKLEQRRAADATLLPGMGGSMTGGVSSVSTGSERVSQPPSSRPGSSPRDSVDASAMSGVAASDDVETTDMEWAPSLQGRASGTEDGSRRTAAMQQQQQHYGRPSTSEAFNYSLTQDPMWGVNPPAGGPTLGARSVPQQHMPRAPAPARPSERTTALPVGRAARQPRERTGVDQRSSLPERKHLAPAPFGKTTGHGLSVAGVDPQQQREPSPQRPKQTDIVTVTDKAKLYFKQEK
jgi:hypothetical protein